MLYEHQTQPLLEKLRAGDIDLASSRCRCRSTGWKHERSTTRALRSPCRTTVRWRSAPTSRSTTSTARTLLLLEDWPPPARALVCSRIDVESEDYRATSLETLRQMVAAGLGITLLPSWRRAARSAPARAHGQGIRAAGPLAQRRRSVAQEHGAHGRNQGCVRRDPLLDGFLSGDGRVEPSQHRRPARRPDRRAAALRCTARC